MPHRIIKSIDGRRGGSLAIIAALFVVIGQSIFRVPTQSRQEAMAWLPDWFTTDVLGAIVMVLASVSLVCAVTSRWWKWSLVIGYASAFAAAIMLSSIYLIATLFGISSTAYYNAAIFGGFAALIYVNSGWDEGRQRPPLTDAQRKVLASPPEGER